MKAMLEKIKNSKLAKVIVGSVSSCAVAAMGVVGAFAEEVTPSQALTTAVTTIKTDFLSYVAIVLPVALAIFGIVFGIRKAIGFFRSAAGGTR